ncbi:hypothetical protein [Aquimarina algicola]|uniref:Uncharacterized protein n=1 Tax=Aquimarina algicola TaxID=2589995 RepID=A0A504JGM2_9FLAO|nr:hypothetical protein [Aquimarina algicola]TPN86918.1 hypothetical protein FHK87_04765 [Aquimarina algicola]
MNLKKKYNIIGICIILLCCVGFTAVIKPFVQEVTVLEKPKTSFVAGKEVVLDFRLSKKVTTRLFIHSSFGSTLLMSSTGRFILPTSISEKKGIISYTLFLGTKKLAKGEIIIEPNLKTPLQLESYVGPPSIIAGGKDYTMQVVIAKDGYDNPLPDSTAIWLKHQFLNIEKEETVLSKDMIGWQNRFSYDQSGRLLLSSQVNAKISKEFSVEVFPSLPEDFEINSIRKHNYADGNQIVELMTSVLKDQYGNIISDGTWVTYNVIDAKGALLKTQGSTVNGVAVAKILHPDHKDTWKIKAYVPGIAESNTITIAFEPVIEDYPIEFRMQNREIVVGPLSSFMNQLIPNGALVEVKIINENHQIETLTKSTFEGKAKFVLKKEFYPSGIYDIHIKALGVHKEFKQLPLE